MRGSQTLGMIRDLSATNLSQGRSPSPGPCPDTKKPKPNNIANIKSLHVGTRKRELERIEAENLKIA
jgi:hypothetical protein